MESSKKILIAILIFLSVVANGQEAMFFGLLNTESSILKNGLFSCWELDETSGTTVNDSYTYGSRNGVNYNCTVNQTGKIGKAYELNKVNSSYIGGITKFISDFPFSLSMWFYYTSEGHLFSSNVNSGTNKYGVTLKPVASSGKMSFYIYYGQGTTSAVVLYVGNVSSLATSTWHHLVLTSSGYDYSQNTLYINNTSYACSYLTGSVSSVNWSTGTTEIGRDWVQAQYFSGRIDQVAVWGRVLSSSDVSLLYNSGNALTFINW